MVLNIAFKCTYLFTKDWNIILLKFGSKAAKIAIAMTATRSDL